MNNDLFALAITKKLKLSEQISPGEYPVRGQVTIDVDAIIKKCNKEEYTPSAQIPWQSVVAVLVKRYNIKQAELEEIIIESFNEAKQNDTAIADSLVSTKRAIERVQRTLAKLPKQVKEGKTLINGIVRVVNISTNPVSGETYVK